VVNSLKKWVVDFGQKSVSHLNYMQHHVAELYATSMCLLPAYSQCSTSRPNFSRSVSVERVLGPRPLRRGRSNFKTSFLGGCVWNFSHGGNGSPTTGGLVEMYAHATPARL